MIIIASDYDGTVNYQGKISNEDKEAIRRFRQKGNKFGIVTGRDVEVSSWIRQEDGFEFDFLICCTGGVIKNENGEIIYAKKGIVGDFFKDIIEKAISFGATFFAINDVMFKCYIDVNGAISTDLSRMPEFTHSNCGFKTEEDAALFEKYVNDNYSDKICAYRNGWHVDMPPVGTSKVTGIYEYASNFDNPKIYAVGDNVNDIPMIKEFNGYAVSNAKDSVKSVAKHQCNRIADMINEILAD